MKTNTEYPHETIMRIFDYPVLLRLFEIGQLFFLGYAFVVLSKTSTAPVIRPDGTAASPFEFIFFLSWILFIIGFLVFAFIFRLFRLSAYNETRCRHYFIPWFIAAALFILWISDEASKTNESYLLGCIFFGIISSILLYGDLRADL